MSDYNQLKIFKTNDLSGWEITGTDAVYNDKQIFGNGVKRTVQINPQFQYTYIPHDDYVQKFVSGEVDLGVFSADEASGTISVDQVCSTIPANSITLKLTITDRDDITDTLIAD